MVVFKNDNVPCKGCSDRVVGCHSTCEKYAEFVKENNKRLHEQKKIAKEEYRARSYTIDSVYRVQGKKKFMK